MKHTRLFLTLIAMVTVLVAMADKKMTIRCEETGESFEVTVPDGLRIYEYNGNWLDSIPYLTEHARNGEPWAYEALGDCYRFGKGGVNKSIINALGYYDLAGKDVDEVISDIEKVDHDDPFAVFPRLIVYLEEKNYDKVICAIDTLNEYDYHSADILMTYIHHMDKGMRLDEILEFIMSKDTDADAAFIAAGGSSICMNLDTIKSDLSAFVPVLMNKIPVLYSEFGVRKYKKTINAETPSGYAEDVTAEDADERKKAVEYLLKADELGVLSKVAARWICHYCTYDSTSDWVRLTEEDWNRIEQIAGQ